jgi:hypothetical protein
MPSTRGSAATIALGMRRGALSDWLTQQWVKVTGRRVPAPLPEWLHGPVGKTSGVGRHFFNDLAAEEGLEVRRNGPTRGLLALERLRGPNFDPDRVSPTVRAFYERTSDFEMESWSEWCGFFKPFGRLLAIVFSRRLQQLNVPLDPLDTSGGTTTEVVQLVGATGEVKLTAWIRELPRTGNVLYAGSYLTCMVPNYGGPCVHVVFPLPTGNALVILRPEVHEDGSMTVTSSGRRFGDPGFYFTVHCSDERVWARYVRAMRESIHVYESGEPGEVRGDHVLRFFGFVFLRLHYRLRQRTGNSAKWPSQHP